MPTPSQSPLDLTATVEGSNGIEPLAERLLQWFDGFGRKDLPWQQNITPYSVWVSEIMLQQTQVATVIPYYQRFMTRFPNVSSLASAEQDEVLHLWTGLGYYARGRNLHKAAKMVVDCYNGEFPNSVEELITLPGVGRSTAGAIASIAMGLRAPILDGNVKRVLARHHAVPGWPGETSIHDQLWQFAEVHTPEDRVGDYTQAIMDLGATLCTRSKPDCKRCPLAESCVALAQGNPSDYPDRKPRKTLPQRTTIFLICRNPTGEVLLEQRNGAGVWQGLYCFPELTSVDDIHHWCLDHLGKSPLRQEAVAPIVHTFSHYQLSIQPIVIDVEAAPPTVAESSSQQWVQASDPGVLGLPAPVARLLQQLSSR